MMKREGEDEEEKEEKKKKRKKYGEVSSGLPRTQRG